MLEISATSKNSKGTGRAGKMPWGSADWELKNGGPSWGREEGYSGPSKVPGAARRCCKKATDATGWGPGEVREERGQSLGMMGIQPQSCLAGQ